MKGVSLSGDNVLTITYREGQEVIIDIPAFVKSRRITQAATLKLRLTEAIEAIKQNSSERWEVKVDSMKPLSISVGRFITGDPKADPAGDW